MLAEGKEMENSFRINDEVGGGTPNTSVSLACLKRLVCHFRAVLGVMPVCEEPDGLSSELGSWQMYCRQLLSPVDNFGPH